MRWVCRKKGEGKRKSFKVTQATWMNYRERRNIFSFLVLFFGTKHKLCMETEEVKGCKLLLSFRDLFSKLVEGNWLTLGECVLCMFVLREWEESKMMIVSVDWLEREMGRKGEIKGGYVCISHFSVSVQIRNSSWTH